MMTDLVELAARVRAEHNESPERVPLHWVGSLWFVLPALVAVAGLLWARAQGWLA